MNTIIKILNVIMYVTFIIALLIGAFYNIDENIERFKKVLFIDVSILCVCLAIRELLINKTKK